MSTMSEKTPLLHYRLSSNTHGSDCGQSIGISLEKTPHVSSRETDEKPMKKLSTFFGVIIPTVLSMFSVVVFLRIGKW